MIPLYFNFYLFIYHRTWISVAVNPVGPMYSSANTLSTPYFPFAHNN